MSAIIVRILSAYFLAYYTVNVVRVDMALKRALKITPGKRLKPIDCTQCLSVWLSVLLYWIDIKYSIFIMVAFGAGWIGSKIK